MTKVICIKPIVLDGEDDGLDDTMICDVGDKLRVYPISDGSYVIDEGTAVYTISPDEFKEYFKVITNG